MSEGIFISIATSLDRFVARENAEVDWLIAPTATILEGVRHSWIQWICLSWNSVYSIR